MKNPKLTRLQQLVGVIFCLVGSVAFSRGALRETVGGPDTSATVINLQGGLLTYDGGALPGANVGLTTRISRRAPLYLGADLGLFLATGTPSYATLPLLGSFYYQFEPAAGVHPLLGVLAGPVVSTGGDYSTVRWGTLFRPGINFELGEAAVLNVEGRMGVIGSSFVFLPEIGAIFPI